MRPSRRTPPPTTWAGATSRAASARGHPTAGRATRRPSPRCCATARRGRARSRPRGWTTPRRPDCRTPRRPRRGASGATIRPSTTKPFGQSADRGGEMKTSAASLYQIDERGLELRRAYMGMTAAERELLGGMQAWAERNAAEIGAKLAEHTFSNATSGEFLTDYANAKGIR